MKLFYSPGSCSLAPHIVLEELGCAYATQLVSSQDGSTQSAEYLAINPKGRVPVLQIEDEVLTEAPAIMMYLATQFYEKRLVPETPLGRARVMEWMNWLTCIHASMIAMNWRTYRFTDEKSQFTSIRSKGLSNVAAEYAVIESKLKAGAWAMETGFSIVDAYLTLFYRWGNVLGLDMQAHVNWTDHAKRMDERPAVKTVLAHEGLSLWGVS